MKFILGVATNASHDSLEFEKRLYEFCCEEIGQYWLPLGLRLGSSLVELRAIGNEFDRYGDSYKALAVVRKHMADHDGDATFSKIRAILLEVKRSSANYAETIKILSSTCPFWKHFFWLYCLLGVPQTPRQFLRSCFGIGGNTAFLLGQPNHGKSLVPYLSQVTGNILLYKGILLSCASIVYLRNWWSWKNTSCYAIC